MTTNQYTPEKPGMLTAIAIMTLINGILNIIFGFTFTTSIVLGTLGIGLLCAPITITPVVLGIFEILYAVKLLPNPIQPGAKLSQAIPILEICCILTGNVVSLTIGILAVVFANDQSVRSYFASRQ
jgi:hypothetical protein